MNIRRLIELLEKEDGDRLVVMAKDSEGNGYSPLSGFWTGKYEADTSHSGEVGLEALNHTDEEAGYGEEDILIGGVKAVILSPIN